MTILEKQETEAVDCHDIERLLYRCESLKPIIYRWACDHGQGSMKFIIQSTYQINYIDDVKGCFLIATVDTLETRHDLGKNIRMLPIMNISKNSNVITVCGIK